jgi:mannosylfructose-phosphate synthase
MDSKRTATNGLARRQWHNYAFVLGGICLATAIRFPIQPAIHFVSPFLFYFPVVLAAAVGFGRRFGLLATSLSVLPANYFWMFPENAFEFNVSDFCQISSFLLAGISVSWLGDLARKRKVLEEHVRSTLATMGEAIVTTDCQGHIVCFNTMAEILTETSRQQATGGALGSAFDLFSEDGDPLNETFQSAMNNDEIEHLPKRVILVSKSGRQHWVDQRASRILDVKGRKVGTAILFLRSASGANHARTPEAPKAENPLNLASGLPRIALVFVRGPVSPQASLEAGKVDAQVIPLLEWSKQLAQLGYEVDIWTNQGEGQSQIEPVASQVRIIRVPGGGADLTAKHQRSESLPDWGKSALDLIRNHRLNYVFIHSHYWDGGFAGRRLSQALNVPHLHTPHSLGIDESRPMDKAGGNETAQKEAQDQFSKRITREKSVCTSANLVLASSPQERELLVGDYGVAKEKCFVIGPGYDDTRFFPVGDFTRQAIRKRLGINSPLILSVERLTNSPACELLLKAFANVTQQIPEAVLHLAVSGKSLTPPEEAVFFRLRALVGELNLTGKVRFADLIPDDQLADYCRAADVFVLTNPDESITAMATKAMACGTPTVLAVPGGTSPGVSFGRPGLHADPGDPNDLGTMILKILKDSRLRLQLSRLGAEKARDSFTWTGVAQQFLALAAPKAAGDLLK